jgi:RNA polymerase sigma factor (sigma-70 family)
VAKRVLQLGAMGYGNALMSPHFILSAIHTLRENMIWLAPDLTSQLIMDIPPQEEKNNIDELLSVLTKREKEVALLLRDALTYKEIADKLGISPRTVKAHAHAIYKKLDTHDRIGLALLLK